MQIRNLKAEPLTAEAWAPFGQLVQTGDCTMELRDGEQFFLNVLSYDRYALRVDHLNRHHKATQMLVALAGRPTVVVVAPREADFTRPEHFDTLRAFICDGTAGINLGLAVWHWGPAPLMDHVDLVNVQGAGFLHDNEVAYLEQDHELVYEISL